MKIYKDHIPLAFFLKRTAQIVPEQNINESVPLYELALPYILCELQSTIQHESAHRQDNEQYVDTGEQDRVDFTSFTSKSRAEPIAEREEESCDGLLPENYAQGPVINKNLNQLFEEAKDRARIDSTYRKDIKAGGPGGEVAGMYMMHDTPSSMSIKDQVGDGVWETVDKTLWIDIRKRVEPFIADSSHVQDQPHPATHQTDGIEPDMPGVSNKAVRPAVPAVPFVPATPGVEAR